MNTNGTIEIKANFFSTSIKRVRCFPNIFKKREFKVQKETIEEIGMSFDQLANGMFLNEHQELGNDLNNFQQKFFNRLKSCIIILLYNNGILVSTRSVVHRSKHWCDSDLWYKQQRYGYYRNW